MRYKNDFKVVESYECHSDQRCDVSKLKGKGNYA